MRFVVTGRGGQLGSCLEQRLRAARGDELVAAHGRDELDLERPDQLSAIFDQFTGALPDVVVNAAAYTKVDLCEDHSALANRVNADAPETLARACKASGVQLIHVSTDYVFDGGGSEPYATCAPTNPQSVYGASKLAGEQRVLATSPNFAVVRTSWVFGPGHNFVATMLRLAREQRSGSATGKMRVVDDQRGCPTYADDLAEGILALARAKASGLFHLCNSEPTTWWDFAREILDRCGYADIEIERGKTADLAMRAPRPRYSVLDCSRAAALGIELRPWKQALAAYLDSESGRRAQQPS